MFLVIFFGIIGHVMKQTYVFFSIIEQIIIILFVFWHHRTFFCHTLFVFCLIGHVLITLLFKQVKDMESDCVPSDTKDCAVDKFG